MEIEVKCSAVESVKEMLRKVPLIVILGSTGTGKTKLSIELAERFGGEIISADSMQVYANLDIVTAKATKQERSRAKHHLLDVATPSEPFTVVHFRNAALPIIDNLLAQSKPPIVVGGTNYYIESLLWDILVSPNNQTPSFGKRKFPEENQGNFKETQFPFLSESDLEEMPSEKLHEHLKEIDPESANRLHPNNRRKIKRAIEFYQETGETLSTKLKEQREKPGGNRLGGPLRYPHTILFWLRCQQDVLNARLDKRVDAMLEQGLLQEIRAFHEAHYSSSSGAGENLAKTEAIGSNETAAELGQVAEHVGHCNWLPGKPTDAGTAEATKAYSEKLFDLRDKNPFTLGVLQTIGYKEFLPYLVQFDAQNDQKIEEFLKKNSYQMPIKELDHVNSKKTGSGLSEKPSTTKITKKEGEGEVLMKENEKEVEKNFPPGLDTLYACLNELKLVTRRYSKKQIKWINNRFLASKDRQVPDLYELDTTDVSAWQQNVYQRAVAVLEAYQHEQVCEVRPMAKRQHPGAGLNEETTNFCKICQRHFIGEFQWQLHLKSNKHKKRAESERKLQRLKEKCQGPKREEERPSQQPGDLEKQD